LWNYAEHKFCFPFDVGSKINIWQSARKRAKLREIQEKLQNGEKRSEKFSSEPTKFHLEAAAA
jgi:hypothetical protein